MADEKAPKKGKTKSLKNPPAKSVRGGIAKSKQRNIKIREEILKDIKANALYTDTISKLSTKFRLSESKIKEQYSLVNKELREITIRDILDVRDEMLVALVRDLEEARTNYLTEEVPAIRLKWYQVYLDIKDTIRDFFPDMNKPIESPTTAIQINNISLDSDDEAL